MQEIQTINGAGECAEYKGKPARNATMDVLRVIAMLFIVVHHLTVNNIGLTEIQEFIDGAKYCRYCINAFIDCFTIIGVNLFFLLSGYFGLRLRTGRILPLIIKVYFYFTACAVIGYAAGLIEFKSLSDGIVYCLSAPGKYWFVLAYIAVFLLSPLLNVFTESLKPAEVKYFVFASLLFCCAVGFAADYVFPVTGTNNGYSPVWAAIVYAYGRLINLHGARLKKSAAFWTAFYVAPSLINFGIIALFMGVFENGRVAWHFYGYNNPLVLLSSVAFFMIFLSAKPLKNKTAARAASLIASHTFAVYQLHSNNPLLPRWRAFLIDLFGENALYAKYLVLLPNAVIIILLCVAVDIVYDRILKKPTEKFGAAVERGLAFIYKKIQLLACAVFTDKNAPTK